MPGWASWAIRIALGVAAIYLSALTALYFAQAYVIYPAPQHRHEPAPDFVAIPLRTEDGLTLTAHFRPPEARQPTLVFFHGNAGSLAGATEETALHAIQGYGVLLVSYRGYGGNPGDPSEEGFYQDGRAALAFLAKQGVTPDKTIVIGNSIGSGTATQMAREFDPAALILVSPFSSLTDVASESMPIMPVEALLRDRYDNIEKVPELTIPILIQHGTADRVVPFAHGKRLAEAAPTATFQSYEGAGHDLSFLTEAQIAQSEWLAEQGL